MLHVVEKTLKIKGLKEEKTIVGIADVHLTLRDERDNDDYSIKLQQERSFMFPNASSCFAEIREYVKKAQPDAVMACGDIIDFPSAANLDIIDEFFNKECKEYVYTLGNHDWNYPRTYNQIYNWLDNVPQFPVIKDHNPLIQTVDLGDVLLVAVDNQADRVFPETVRQFKELIKLGKPMILCMHVPAYSPEIGEIIMHDEHQHRLLMMGVPQELEANVGNCRNCLCNAATTEFMELLHDPSVPVKAILAGHVHFEFRAHDFIAEEEFAPGKIQYGLRLSAPQLTPEGIVLSLKLVPDNN